MRGIEGVVLAVMLRVIVVGVEVQRCAGSTVFKVGDSSGWTIGVDYSTWASSNTFLVGDTLVFNYASGHTVDLVSKSDYSTCTIGNAISTDSSGATRFPLKSPGTLFFICGVVGHCGSGMKLSITIAGASSTTPVTPPSAGSTTTNTTTTTGGSVPCTPSQNVYGIPTAGTTPFYMSESPRILSAAALPFAGALLVFQMLLLRLI